MRAEIMADAPPAPLVTEEQLATLFDAAAAPEQVVAARSLIASYGTPILRSILDELASVRRQLSSVQAENRRLRSRLREAREGSDDR